MRDTRNFGKVLNNLPVQNKKTLREGAKRRYNSTVQQRKDIDEVELKLNYKIGCIQKSINKTKV